MDGLDVEEEECLLLKLTEQVGYFTTDQFQMACLSFTIAIVPNVFLLFIFGQAAKKRIFATPFKKAEWPLEQ
jgi:hypothetical protein